jgi:hypothetical protein
MRAFVLSGCCAHELCVMRPEKLFPTGIVAATRRFRDGGTRDSSGRDSVLPRSSFGWFLFLRGGGPGHDLIPD